MNAQRTFSAIRRIFALLPAVLAPRLLPVSLAAVLLALVPLASQAGKTPAMRGGSGAVLALAAQLRAVHHQNVGDPAPLGFHTALTQRVASNGRMLLDPNSMHSGALRKHAASSTVVPISSGVQTYDVSNPPAAFRPLIGYGSATALDNDSSNPPVYIGGLVPTNKTPIWSADETYLVFSSDRDAVGGLNHDASDGVSARFHLWAISVNGGEAFQITTSTGPAGGGEFFPALSANNNKVAFTSDAQSAGYQNLYTIAFSSAALTAGAAPVNVSDTATISSLTLRYGPGIVSGTTVPTEASSASFTGFTTVLRPTFAPGDDQLIVFSAYSISGIHHDHTHLYFLYQSSGGFSNSNNTSYPGKLTDGPADDTDPAFSPDGQFIAFSSTATTVANNSSNSFGPNPPSNVQDPNQSQSLTAGPVATRSIFLISGGGSANGIPFGTVPSSGGLAGGRVTVAGTDNYGPAWSSFANQNQYTNPAPGFAYLAFARASAETTNHDIYYLQVGQGVSSPSTETLTPESTGNPVVHLNTDDNPGETTSAGNAYNDVYPSWSPFLSIFSITYASNRTVTYNSPANSQPTETAASVPPGGTVTNPQDTTANYYVDGAYSGLLISQVLNLDPPTLLRFSDNEVVHVQSAGTNPVTGTPNKLAASGGQPITLTVRLSDREAGIDDTGGPNGGPRVYIQIKDPSSKYQNAQGLEHKVFMKDRRYELTSQVNRRLNDITSTTANGLLDIYNYSLPTSDLYSSLYYNPFNTIEIPTYKKYEYPSYGGAPDVVGTTAIGPVAPRGTHGGQWLADGTNNAQNTYLFVGKQGGGANGLTNAGKPYPTTPAGTFSYPITGGRQTLIDPGTDPAQFIPQGPEYECQLVNPIFAGPHTVASDYATPYYLAGVDDQGAFSGGLATDALPKDRPATEWLQLTRVSNTQQDHNGGVLYTTTWTTPADGSDFYVDVIAFDKAVFPNISSSPYAGQKTNWRIYDNVGGFSTNQNIGNNDILVVSDYALGQKFAASTFGGRNSNLNLVPKLFGTESYITDVDVNVLPDSVYAGIPTTELTYSFNPVVQQFGYSTLDLSIPYSIGAVTDPGPFPPPTSFGGAVVAQNGLGAQSYIDTTINDNTVNSDGVPNVQSQRYSIWRILSRGPVPQTVLNSYLPKPVQQPAILDADPTATPYADIPAATVLDASQCVIWLSPYTGDVLADPGTIDDPGNVGQTGVTSPRQSTTSILTSFVQAGGRLCVTGQDVGSTLTLGGTVNNAPSTTPGSPNFLPDVLNATLVPGGVSSNVLTGTSNRITGSPFYDNTDVAGNARYLTLTGPIQGGNTIVSPNLPYQDNLVLGDADYGDSALSQIPALTLPGGTSVQGEPDVIAAANGAQVAVTYAAGGGALVYHDDPYLGGTAGLAKGVTAGQLPNGGTGSRVVYAGFGIEGLTNDYYSSASPNSTSSATAPNPLPLDEIIPVVIPRNPRSAILHNIVNYLRTGRVSGSITQTAGTGQGGGLGIDGVTVYLRPTGAAPSTRVAFSATTSGGGIFTIAGVEPGTYTLVAIKPGFQRAVSNAGISFTVEGDVTKTGATLTMTPLPPANIAGVVQDTSKNQINGATITFTSQDNSITRTVTTVNGSVPGNAAENYFLQSVPVTTYTATATGPLNNQGLPEYTPVIAADGKYAAGITTQPNTTTQPVDFTLTAIPATVAGTITDAATGQPISGATVKLLGPLGGTRATLTTGANGTYSFTNIVATSTLQNFTVSATAPQFLTNTVVQPLQAGNAITGLTVPLTPVPTGNISGTVTDNVTGAGLVGATVTFTPTFTGGTVQTATTGPGGTYTITGIVTGAYSGVATGPTTGEVYLPSAAQPVSVTNGVTATADFALTGVPSGGISGTVYDQRTSLPLVGATVTFTIPGGVTRTAITGANGTYMITGVPTGTYSGIATGPTTGQVYLPSSAQSVTVSNGRTAIANFLLVPNLATITGTVTDASTGLPLAGATITLADTGGNAVTTTPIVITTAANGTYSATFAPGTYLVTAAATNYTTQTTAATAFPVGATVPVPFHLVSTIGTLGGLVTDADGVTPLVGATVTATLVGQTVGLTFTTLSAPVTAPDGKTLNYSGSLVHGTYTVVVTKAGRQTPTQTITVVGGQFNRLDFTGTNSLPAIHTFPAGVQFVSTPYDYSSLGFDSIFGALNTAPVGTTPNGNRSHVAVWNPLTDAYALDPTAPADTLRLGVGYWVYLNSPFQVTQQGATPTTDVAVSLGKGWNQIGVPYPIKNSAGQYIGVSLSRLKFDNGSGGTITFAQASSSSYNIISPSIPLYSYSSAGGYQAVSSTGTLAAWQGYWIYVNVPVTLEIPTTATN